MKIVMDEKLKHRLIGLAVIISLGAIFAPAVMRKSNQRAEDNFSVNVKLPPKPVTPNVAVTDEKDMFKTIKISRVDVPPASEENQLPELAKAEPLKVEPTVSTNESEVAAVEPDLQAESIQLALDKTAQVKAHQVIKLAANKAVKRIAAAPIPKKNVVHVAQAKVKPPVHMNAKQIAHKDVYAVQLASFSQISNAQALVTRLRGKGYKANFIKLKGKQGPIYKVFAGHSPRKNDAVKLKSQLALAMQLNGFVVNTGVS